MNDIVTVGPEVGLDWTDQVRAVARFISDHELPLISMHAVPNGWQTSHQTDCNVSIQIQPEDYPRWWVTVEKIVDEHARLVGDDSLHLHVAAEVAGGLRVELVYVQRLGLAVA